MYKPPPLCRGPPPRKIIIIPASGNSISKRPRDDISQDAAANFKVNVRLVEVHVVVRDAQGKAIGTLRKEDFQLFDDRKPQVITKFSVQRPGLQVEREQQTSQPANSNAGAASATPPPDVPERYIAYVFDDIHMAFGDLALVREAATKNLETLRPTDRAAIFTISGQHDVDFTDDRAKLQDGLRRLMPRPLGQNRVNDCPKMTYYMADLIQNKNDPQALEAGDSSKYWRASVVEGAEGTPGQIGNGTQRRDGAGPGPAAPAGSRRRSPR